ncbi:transcription factor IIF subunit tfg1 [Coemansia sp. RSA 2050]|nr:transcription factor IIF subunit tfg1 [Coemansia sp. RSA 2050]KAJ2731066.1 transcription factor IIF subunit tfg1 [Coemansia sp. BCRC 34962]
MSSGIRRLEKKTGSAGMRNLGSRLSSRPNSTPRPANSTARPDSIPLAAATGLSASASSSSSSAQPAVDTRSSVEYTLVSSTRPARTHNVMRLLTPKSVDLQTFTPPVKLRRRNKEYYRLKNKKRNEEKAEALEAEEKKKRQQLEADGVLMEVDGVAEAKKEESAVPIYMVKEKPKVDINLIADRGGARSNKRNLFKKKTKQVFFADEEKRRLDIEEARPWVLEDDDEKEVWTGSLEGGQSSTYVLFVLTDDGFKVVPVDRWYKFTPKLKYKTLTLDEAEEELKRAQKSEAQDRWIMHKRMVRLDVNADGEGPAAPGGSERAQGSGGMQLSRSKLVEREIDDDMGFDDDDDGDDEEGGKGKAPKKRGSEGGRQGGEDFDFEMEFDDDEELGDVQFEYNEEEATQKKEQRQKASGSGYGSEGEEEDEDDQAASKSKFAAKHTDLRKLLRKREGRSEYKSDDDDANPYLTPSDSDSDEEEEEEDLDKKKEPEKPEDAAAATATGSAKPAPGAQQTGKPAATAASAAAAAAKKRKRVSVAPTGHHHHQPHVRASSPASAASGSSADSRKVFKSNTSGSGRPTGAASPASSSGSPPPPSSPASADLITKQEIVDLIKSGVNTTKKLITCVRKKLKANPANKVRIQAIVKEVATLKDGELALKRA